VTGPPQFASAETAPPVVQGQSREGAHTPLVPSLVRFRGGYRVGLPEFRFMALLIVVLWPWVRPSPARREAVGVGFEPTRELPP
jgi:hypothetical protein